MNRTHFLLSIFALAVVGCSSNNSEQKNTRSKEISYELDTVMVDAGDEFIHVQWQMMSSDLSKDETNLFNFKTGSENPGLEIIDLEKLKLDQVIPMSLDGPNGIRHPYISDVYLLSDGSYYFSNSYDIFHFDQNGNKLSTLTFSNHEFIGDKLPDGTRIDLNQTLSEDEKSIITFYSDEKLENAPLGFTVFDLENESFYYKPLDILKELEKYRINLYFNGYPSGAMFSSFHLLAKNDSLIFSNGGVNQLYFYDLETDSLSFKSYNSQYTSYEITKSFPGRVESEEEYRALIKDSEKEVRYGPLYFDRKNEVYWRFTSEFDRMKGDTTIFDIVLTAFNPQFEQIGEVLLQDDFVLPYKVFMKDGLIWTFLNMDDEVAFVRLKPTLK
jgi:hypothetical protein